MSTPRGNEKMRLLQGVPGTPRYPARGGTGTPFPRGYPVPPCFREGKAPEHCRVTRRGCWRPAGVNCTCACSGCRGGTSPTPGADRRAAPRAVPLAGSSPKGNIYAFAAAGGPPLILQENFTVKLLEMLRTGEIDCAILAEPFPDTGLALAPLYDEPFFAALPATHALAVQTSVSTDELKRETMLLLGNGHCFRDHVLEVCPEFARFSSDAEGIRKSFEGSSLETIKHMVAAGMGITLVPRLSVPASALNGKKTGDEDAFVKYLPVQDGPSIPPPTRRVVLAWRRSFTRYEAIAALRNAIYGCRLEGVARLS